MKLKIKIRISLVIYILLMVNVTGQTMVIGDECPDITIRNIINYPKTEAKISDFRGKLLIIDFWGTFCSPCIAAFPKQDELQKLFRDDLVILPVTAEDKKKVMLFLNKMNNIKHILPASVTNDTTLRRLFKHAFIPHYVWIDKNSKVIAITTDKEVNEGNIRNAITGNLNTLAVKKDVRKLVDLGKPVFSTLIPIKEKNKIQMEPVEEGEIMFKSIITKYSNGLTGFQSTDKNRISLINLPLESIYRFILAKKNEGEHNDFFQLINPSRTIWEIKDSILYKKSNSFVLKMKDKDSIHEWNLENAICYELVKSATISEKDMYKWALADVNRYFGSTLGIKASLEKRTMKCMALIRISSEDKIASKGGKKSLQDNAYFFKMKNNSLKWFMARMSGYYLQNLKLPLLDETGYAGNVDIELNAKLSDINAVNLELEKIGLKFIETVKEIDMIVITKQ